LKRFAYVVNNIDCFNQQQHWTTHNMLQRTHSVHFNLTNKDILSTMIPSMRSPPSHGHLKSSNMIILEVDPRMYIESELKENKKVIWVARCMHCIHIIPFIIFICFVILWLGSSSKFFSKTFSLFHFRIMLNSILCKYIYTLFELQ
jgi:hypothetical protein